MTPRGLLLAALLLGPAAAPGGLGQVTGGSVLPVPSLPALPPVTEPVPVTPNTALLLDGQRLTISLSFSPGQGSEYPPAGPFSRDQPAYYSMQGSSGPLSLSVQSSLPGATLVLRAAPAAEPGRPTLPVSRVEYSVGGAPFQPCQSVQVIALLPASGSATYELRLRLRLEGDEPAGQSRVLLSWSVEAR